MLPLLTLISAVVLLVAVTVVLFIIDPAVALIAAIGFGASYGLITWLTRRRLGKTASAWPMSKPR